MMTFFSNQTNRMDRKSGRHFVFAVDKNGTIQIPFGTTAHKKLKVMFLEQRLGVLYVQPCCERLVCIYSQLTVDILGRTLRATAV